MYFGSTLPVQIWRAPHEAPTQDVVITEGPLQILIDGEAVAVTMRTPGLDDALAIGFALGEGILDRHGDVTCHWQPCDRAPDAAIINILAERSETAALPAQRGTLSVASCGLCGIRSIDDLPVLAAQVVEHDQYIEAQCIHSWFTQLAAGQHAFQQSGGCHGAALFDEHGTCLSLAEDVGRHNAVDKAHGLAWLDGRLDQAQALAVSGRLSFEIIAKAAQLGIPVVAAVSAPSSLAVSEAERAGITLIAFCRGERYNVYSHPERLRRSSQECPL